MSDNQYIKIVDDLTPLENDQLKAIQAKLAEGAVVLDRPNYWQEMYNKFWVSYENRKLKEKKDVGDASDGGKVVRRIFNRS